MRPGNATPLAPRGPAPVDPGGCPGRAWAVPRPPPPARGPRPPATGRRAASRSRRRRARCSPLPGEPVVDVHRLDRHPRVERGLEDGPPEVALRPAAPGAALREGHDGHPVAQQPGDPRHRVRQRAQPVAFDERQEQPPRAASGPATGHCRISDLASILAGRTAARSGMSSHEMWLATISSPAGGDGGAGDPDADARGPHDRPAPAPYRLGGDPPAERQQHDPGGDHDQDRREPQHGTRYGRGGPVASTHALGVQGALGSQTLIRPGRARGSAADSAG